MVHPKEKAEAVAQYFATKLSADGIIATQRQNPTSEKIRVRFQGGRWRLSPAIDKAEVSLAARDLPTNRAPGPDEIPAEFYIILRTKFYSAENVHVYDWTKSNPTGS